MKTKTALIVLAGCACVLLSFLGMWEVMNETENLPANNHYLAVSIGYAVLLSVGLVMIFFRKNIADRLQSRYERMSKNLEQKG